MTVWAAFDPKCPKVFNIVQHGFAIQIDLKSYHLPIRHLKTSFLIMTQANETLFVLCGPGDVGGTLNNWKDGKPEDRIPAVALSQQLFDFCRDRGLLLLISPNIVGAPQQFENVTVHPVKLTMGRGPFYFISSFARGFRAARIARKAKASVCVVSNDLDPIGLLPFVLWRGKCIYEFHCTMWPRGQKRSFLRKIKHFADRWIIKLICPVIVCISEECRRQFSGGSSSLYDRTILYLPYYSNRLPTGIKAGEDRHPFRILFAGRIEKQKGVYDVMESAKILELRFSGQFKWVTAGFGKEFDSFKRSVNENGLSDVISVPGHLSRQALIQEIINCHVSVTPTQVNFPEGLSQLPLESTIIGRPSILSTVVPADDHLNKAFVHCVPGNPESLAHAVETLRTDLKLYNDLVDRTASARMTFISGQYSYRNAIESAIKRVAPKMLRD